MCEINTHELSLTCLRKGRPYDNIYGDDRSDWGFAYRATVGALVELHQNLGLSVNYDYIDGTAAQAHVMGAGVRLQF